MPWLYNQVDALVFPSKAEGFGLPCIEAISCGLPVIATNYSGHSQFLNQMTGRFIPVDYKLAPIEDDDYRSSYSQFYGGQAIGQWAMPDIGSIADGMRRFYDAPAIWRAHAMEAMQKVAPEFAWGAIATRALAQLTGKKP